MYARKQSRTRLPPVRGGGSMENPDFLSPVMYARYLEGAGALLPQTDLVMLEFEYMNRGKMESQSMFLRRLDRFLESVSAYRAPLGIEVRNAAYLNREYFTFLRDHGLFHVFSQKLYMPPVFEVYDKYGDLINGKCCIRLLGGDRKEIEQRTGGSRNAVTDEKPELGRISSMVNDLIRRDVQVTVNISNHYEGSAPRTIERFIALL